jgi:Rrf2 family protein
VNRTDRYRLEALLELASGYPEPRSAADIAAARGLPPAYLARILSELGRAEWLETRRGPRGGVSLARPPETISVADVLSPAPDSDSLPLALARLAGELAAARTRCASRITIADLARWERRSAVHDYCI